MLKIINSLKARRGEVIFDSGQPLNFRCEMPAGHTFHYSPENEGGSILEIDVKGDGESIGAIIGVDIIQRSFVETSKNCKSWHGDEIERTEGVAVCETNMWDNSTPYQREKHSFISMVGKDYVYIGFEGTITQKIYVYGDTKNADVELGVDEEGWLSSILFKNIDAENIAVIKTGNNQAAQMLSWVFIFDEKQKKALQKELKKEVPKGHVLHKQNVEMVARRDDNDDVLFKLGEDQYAVVHLTYNKETDPQWPATTLCTWAEFLRMEEQDRKQAP